MKKYLILLLISIILIPINANAETKYLYDVLKNEAESNGLAKEYIGEHHDSFTEEPSKKIYHWYAENDDAGKQVLEKNNVIFGGFCWQMLRTTDTGGVKLIYNGLAINNKCENSRNRVVQPDSRNIYPEQQPINGNYYYSDTYEYDKNTSTFKLNGEIIKRNFNEQTKSEIIGKYTCLSEETTCSKLFHINGPTNNNNANVIEITLTEQPYSQISTSDYNYYNYSPALTGYKYNTIYTFDTSGYTLLCGNDVKYEDGKYTLIDTKNGIDSTHHYSCVNTTGECTTVRYYFYSTYYIELTGGKTYYDILNEQLWSDDVNKYNSHIKSEIDSWFYNNLLSYKDFLEDTIYCNRRDVIETGNRAINVSGWGTNGNLNSAYLYFGDSGTNTEIDISCKLDTDKFSINNTKAKLKYPIGLMTRSEMLLSNNTYTMQSTSDSWGMTPIYYQANPYGFVLHSWGNYSDYGHGVYKGIRPVISLKSDSKYLSGDGSKDNPYIIDTTNYYKVIVEEPVKKGEIEFEIEDISSLKEGTEVKFKITPIKGYKLKDLTITDEEENNVDYTTKDNINFKFTMPAIDVTIKPQYKEIESNIINPNTSRQLLLIVISIIILGMITTLFIKKKKRLT